MSKKFLAYSSVAANQAVRGFLTEWTGDKKITPEEKEKIKGKFNNACAYCGSDTEPLQWDHIVPQNQKLGGLSNAANRVPACRSCNNSKGSRGVEDFLFNKKYPDNQKKALKVFNKIKKHMGESAAFDKPQQLAMLETLYKDIQMRVTKQISKMLISSKKQP